MPLGKKKFSVRQEASVTAYREHIKLRSLCLENVDEECMTTFFINRLDGQIRVELLVQPPESL